MNCLPSFIIATFGARRRHQSLLVDEVHERTLRRHHGVRGRQRRRAGSENQISSG